MNEIILKGKIKNIESSHVMRQVEYDKAFLIVPHERDDREDIVRIKFKKYSNTYNEGDDVTLVGCVRSFNNKSEENAGSVEIYVHTYFNKPENELETNNSFTIDGSICSINELRTTKSGKNNIHFTLANNIFLENSRLDSYLPCVIWGKKAIDFSEKFNVKDRVIIKGNIHTREYTKKYEDGTCEFKVATELIVTEIEKVENAA